MSGERRIKRFVLIATLLSGTLIVFLLAWRSVGSGSIRAQALMGRAHYCCTLGELVYGDGTRPMNAEACEVLVLRNDSLSSDDFQALLSLPNLYIIDLSGSRFRDKDFAILARHKQLRAVVVDQTQDLTSSLTQLKNLRLLSVRGCGMNLDSLKSLSGLPSLELLCVDTEFVDGVSETLPIRSKLEVTDSILDFYVLRWGARL